jgi:hypothetical protein
MDNGHRALELLLAPPEMEEREVGHVLMLKLAELKLSHQDLVVPSPQDAGVLVEQHVAAVVIPHRNAHGRE